MRTQYTRVTNPKSGKGTRDTPLSDRPVDSQNIPLPWGAHCEDERKDIGKGKYTFVFQDVDHNYTIFLIWFV